MSAGAKALCDIIAFKIGMPDTSDRSWLMKNIFSFLNDWWHFGDAVRVLSLCALAVLCFNIPIYWAIGFYIGHGVVFELLYRIK